MTAVKPCWHWQVRLSELRQCPSLSSELGPVVWNLTTPRPYWNILFRSLIYGSFWHCNPCRTTLGCLRGCWMAWPWPSSNKWPSDSRCRNSKIFDIYFYKIRCMIWCLLGTNGHGFLRSSNAVIPNSNRIFCMKKYDEFNNGVPPTM